MTSINCKKTFIQVNLKTFKLIKMKKCFKKKQIKMMRLIKYKKEEKANK